MPNTEDKTERISSAGMGLSKGSCLCRCYWKGYGGCRMIGRVHAHRSRLL